MRVFSTDSDPADPDQISEWSSWTSVTSLMDTPICDAGERLHCDWFTFASFGADECFQMDSTGLYWTGHWLTRHMSLTPADWVTLRPGGGSRHFWKGEEERGQRNTMYQRNRHYLSQMHIMNYTSFVCLPFQLHAWCATAVLAQHVKCRYNEVNFFNLSLYTGKGDLLQKC